MKIERVHDFSAALVLPSSVYCVLIIAAGWAEDVLVEREGEEKERRGFATVDSRGCIPTRARCLS